MSLAQIWVTGAPPALGLGEGLDYKHLVTGPLPMGPGEAQPKQATGTWAHLPEGLKMWGVERRGSREKRQVECGSW